MAKTVDLEARFRKICMGFQDVEERLSHSMPTWFYKGRKSFAMLMTRGQNQFPHFWCAAGPGVQEDLIASDPDRFFRPPYVGGRGWVAGRLDRKPDWALIARLCAEAHRVVSGRA